MSSRNDIITALATLIKTIDGTAGFNSNLYKNVEDKLIFWDEVNDWPLVCVYAGDETRQYLPGSFKWGFLSVPIKIYVNSDNALAELEGIIEDIEKIVDDNGTFQYSTGKTIEDIQILDIATDQGLLHPLGIGEIVLQIQYEV